MPKSLYSMPLSWAELVIKLMKKQIIRILLVSGFVLFFSSCDFLKEEEETNEEQSEGFTNTLDQSLGGNQGAISEYFYNF